IGVPGAVLSIPVILMTGFLFAKACCGESEKSRNARTFVTYLRRTEQTDKEVLAVVKAVPGANVSRWHWMKDPDTGQLSFERHVVFPELTDSIKRDLNEVGLTYVECTLPGQPQLSYFTNFSPFFPFRVFCHSNEEEAASALSEREQASIKAMLKEG